MGRSLTESRRGATLYSASWPRGRPPERSAQRCGGRLPPTSKRSRGASGHFAPSAVAASAAVIAQPAAAIAVSATPVSVATTAAVAEPVAAAALAAFAVSVAPPRSQKEIQTMPAMTEQQVLSRLLQVSGNACGLRRKEAPPPAAAAEVEKASPPATLVVSLADLPRLHDLIAIEQTKRIAAFCAHRVYV